MKRWTSLPTSSSKYVPNPVLKRFCTIRGYGERTALKLLNRYFFNLLGGVTTLRGSLCGGTGQASQNLDLGERISHDPFDHYNSRSRHDFVGAQSASTNISLVPIIRNIRKRGGRVLLIDPARTKTARIVDRHIAPKPGTDAFGQRLRPNLFCRADSKTMHS